MTAPFLRPQQRDIIDLITAAPRGTSTAIEAPTGLGKSRSAMVASSLAGRAIIATSTKALSAQYENELPLLQRHHPGTTFTVLSGKRAMGCTCPRYRKHYDGCPWTAALAKARASDVVITNFALLAVIAHGCIPLGLGSRSTVIIDEAHEFAAPREREPVQPDPGDDTLYWQPHEVAGLLLSPDAPLTSGTGPVRLSLISASINAFGGDPPHDPFALVSAGIPVTPGRSHSLPTPFDWSRQLDLRHVRVPDSDWSSFALDAAALL